MLAVLTGDLRLVSARGQVPGRFVEVVADERKAATSKSATRSRRDNPHASFRVDGATALECRLLRASGHV